MDILEKLKVMKEKDKERVEKDKEKIIFERIQVKENNPAIAQLKITIGEKIPYSKEVLDQIKKYCEKYMKKKYSSVNKDIKNVGPSLVIEARETFKMYSFLQDLEISLKEDIQLYGVVNKGSWAKFDKSSKLFRK